MSSPIVTVTGYAVSVLPDDHPLATYATLAVRRYRSGWVVEDRGEFLHPSNVLRVAVHHWETAEDALATAGAYAPLMPLPGNITAADALAQGGAR